MAVSQEQVDAWFAANPNATAEDVAAAVQSIGGLEANQGLAGMLANRFDIADQEVTNYYNAYTAPTTNEYFKANQDVADAYKQNTYGMTPQEFADYHYTNYGANEGRASSTAGTTPTKNTQTFTDTITSGTPTTQDELLTALADTTTATGNTAATTNTTGNTTATGTTGNTSTTTGNWPSIIYGTTDEDGGRLTTTTTSDGTPFYLRDEDGGGMYQNPNTVESYAPVTGADGKTYYAVYAPVFSSGKAWNETPITGYLTEAQFRALQGGSTLGDAAMGIVNSPVGSFALSVLGPYGQAFNALNQASQGNILGAAVSGLNAAQGFGVTNIGGMDITTAKNAAGLLNAVDKNNLAGALTAGSNLFGGVPGEYQTASTLASAALAVKNGDTAGFLNSLGDLTNSQDAKVAAAAVRLKDVLESGNLSQLASATNNFSAAINGTSTTGSTGSTGSTTVGNFEDTEVTRLKGLGYTNQQIQDYFNNLDNLTDALDTSTSTTGTTTSGLTDGVQLASLDGGLGTTNLGNITSTTFPDLTGDASIKADADLFNSSIGDLDRLDTTRSADEFADFLASIGITSIDQLTDSGLSNQDILDMINAADDTLTVTGAKGNDTVTGIDTITGSDGSDLVVDDKGEIVIKDKKESCPIGTVLNPETGNCDKVPETITCPPGKVLNAAGTACIDEVVVKGTRDPCPTGTVYDEALDKCVPIVAALDCPEGYEPNDAGTACIPVVEIKDKKCDPGFVYDEDLKQCVAIEEEPCGEGYHRENGVCVQDECPDGYVRNLVTGACEKAEDECPTGYERDEITGACIPVVEIKDTKCDPGYVYDEDLKQCVPIKGDEPCAEGYHRDEATGLCVPDDDDKCEDGYEKVNGACVPVCADGYVRNLATGVCEKAEEPCPEGYERDEVTGACIPVVVIKDKKCDPGYVYDEDLKQCVPIEDEPCAEGFHLENGLCVPDGEECEDGYEKVNGACVPVCKDGYVRNLATGVCEKVTEDKPCPPGQVKNAEGKCVPIVTPPPPPPPPPVVKTTPTTYVPSTGGTTSGEKTDPIYAEGMDAFDLFATLQELLAEEPAKKDSKKSKEKTKMATGGHLDDLLAEQMTVDDLLKLLR